MSGLFSKAEPTLVLTYIAYAILAFGYITLTPIWQNPDEPAHFNYVAYVAQTAGLPELRAGDWDSALLERVKNGTLLPDDSVASIQYESWQPPLFYVAAAPLLRIASTDDVPALVLRLRVFNAVLGGATLGFTYLVAREVLPSHLAPAAPLTMVGVPMFTAVSAAISADPLANLLAASLVLVLVLRVRRSIPGESWAIGSGALIGLGLLTKLALAALIPLALIVIGVRACRPMREAVLCLGVAGLVVSPWLVHQVTTYGWTDPLAIGRHSAVVLDQPRFPGLSAEYVAGLLSTSFHSFWAQFGWMAIIAQDRLYWVWGILSLAGIAGVARMQRRRQDPAARLLLGAVLCALLAYVSYNTAFKQFQGRYLFTALVPIAVLLVGGWSAWFPSFARTGVLAIAALLVVLNAYTLLRVVVLGFAPPL